MAKPLITAIIPTYRRPQLLRRAIKSVLNQTYPRFQVCVYDNASGDETASVVGEIMRIDSRVRYHCHPRNIGAYENFVYGMEHVQTPFFSFLSDDDILFPEFYQTAMEGFCKFPDAMFSAGSPIHVTEKWKVVRVPVSSWERDGYYAPPDGLFEMLNVRNVPLWTSIVFRREVIDEVGTLDKEIAIADLDFELRIAARFPFVVSRKPCALYSIHPSSGYHSATFRSLWPGWHKLVRNLTEDKRIPIDVRIRAEHILTEQLQIQLVNYGFRAIRQRDFEGAYKVVEILDKHYHQKARSIVIYTITKLIYYFDPVHFLLLRLYGAGGFLRRNRLTKQFRHYIDYARSIGPDELIF